MARHQVRVSDPHPPPPSRLAGWRAGRQIVRVSLPPSRGIHPKARRRRRVLSRASTSMWRPECAAALVETPTTWRRQPAGSGGKMNRQQAGRHQLRLPQSVRYHTPLHHHLPQSAPKHSAPHLSVPSRPADRDRSRVDALLRASDVLPCDRDSSVRDLLSRPHRHTIRLRPPSHHPAVRGVDARHRRHTMRLRPMRPLPSMPDVHQTPRLLLHLPPHLPTAQGVDCARHRQTPRLHTPLHHPIAVHLDTVRHHVTRRLHSPHHHHPSYRLHLHHRARLHHHTMRHHHHGG